uniref:CSON014582 protein n=1 Tax=Culicoides sonorensis TaxID=179676 RepID=A0A336MB37_CULSO
MSNSICRFCMSQESSMISIFDSNREITEKAKICLNIEIQVDDTLPKVLCEECVNILDGYYQFSLQCQRTEKLLKELHDNSLPDDKVEGDKNEFYFDEIPLKIVIEPFSMVPYSDTTATCDICMFKTNSIEALNLHQQLVHVKDPEESVSLEYKCDLCEKLFLNDEAKRNHLRYSCTFRDTSSYVCDFCGKSFTKKYILKIHLNLHLKSKEFKCKSCDKIYYTRSSLILHYRSHSIEPCPVCQKVLKSYNLPDHMLKHTGKYQFECPLCKKLKYPNKWALNQHMKTHFKSKPSVIESLICECGRKFKSLRGKQCHQANGCESICKDNFSFKCEVCGKGFMKKNNLSRHLICHNENSYKWKCEICDKKFNNSSNFKVHQYSHNTDKNIPCKYCDKLFKNQDSLRSHYVQHEGKLFSCRICDKTLATHTLLKYHMKKKHEIESNE